MSGSSRSLAAADARARLELETALEELRAAAGSARPEGTALQILEATEALLSETGVTKFSMRAVAERVGISLASLQYHYPKRAELLRQFFAFKAESYGSQLDQTLRELSGEPLAALRFTVRFLLDDALQPRTGALYTQLWALASFDRDARAALGKHMRAYVRLISLLVSRARPDLEARAVEHRAVAIVAMIEGLPAGASETKPADQQRLVDELAEFAVVIAGA